MGVEEGGRAGEASRRIGSHEATQGSRGTEVQGFQGPDARVGRRQVLDRCVEVGDGTHELIVCGSNRRATLCREGFDGALKHEEFWPTPARIRKYIKEIPEDFYPELV